MSCAVGRRHSLDLALLWLWYMPAATALIPLLDREPPYVADAALKRPKKKKEFIFSFKNKDITFWNIFSLKFLQKHYQPLYVNERRIPLKISFNFFLLPSLSRWASVFLPSPCPVIHQFPCSPLNPRVDSSLSESDSGICDFTSDTAFPWGSNLLCYIAMPSWS